MLWEEARYMQHVFVSNTCGEYQTRFVLNPLPQVCFCYGKKNFRIAPAFKTTNAFSQRCQFVEVSGVL